MAKENNKKQMFDFFIPHNTAELNNVFHAHLKGSILIVLVYMLSFSIFLKGAYEVYRIPNFLITLAYLMFYLKVVYTPLSVFASTEVVFNEKESIAFSTPSFATHKIHKEACYIKAVMPFNKLKITFDNETGHLLFAGPALIYYLSSKTAMVKKVVPVKNHKYELKITKEQALDLSKDQSATFNDLLNQNLAHYRNQGSEKELVVNSSNHASTESDNTFSADSNNPGTTTGTTTGTTFDSSKEISTGTSIGSSKGVSTGTSLASTPSPEK